MRHLYDLATESAARQKELMEKITSPSEFCPCTEISSQPAKGRLLPTPLFCHSLGMEGGTGRRDMENRDEGQQG